MHRAPFEQRTSESRPTVRLYGNVSDIIHEFGREAERFGAEKDSVLLTGNICLICIAEPSGGFDQSLKHCSQVKRRAADDLEYIRGRRLLLKCLAQLAKQARVLDC